jgi:hypothetical protein
MERYVPVSITLPESLKKRAQERAREEHRNFSNFMQVLLQKELEKDNEIEPVADLG